MLNDHRGLVCFKSSVGGSLGSYCDLHNHIQKQGLELKCTGGVGMKKALGTRLSQRGQKFVNPARLTGVK